MTSPLIVFVTTSSPEEARAIARHLIEEKLAACCTLIDGAHSIYRWEGEVVESSETMMMIKTVGKKYRQLEKRVEELHSYDNPEIIAQEIYTGSRTYLRWLNESVS